MQGRFVAGAKTGLPRWNHLFQGPQLPVFSCRTAPRGTGVTSGAATERLNKFLVAHLPRGAVKLENVLIKIRYCPQRALASHAQTFKTLEDKTSGKGF